MKSVRMPAAGAVVFVSLAVLTAPVSACDDRFIKKCEAEAEAAFVAETQPATATPRRRHTRVRSVVAVERPAVKRTRAPRFAVPAPVQPNEPFRLASAEEQAPPRPESALRRRFRGFIDPQPMTVNSFEALRRPRLDAEHLTPAPAMPPSEEVAVAADDEIVVAEAPSEAARPASVAAAMPAPAPAPVFAQAAPAPGNDTSGFPLHKLVLTLCAALGVAGALRFIVRA